MGIPIMDIVAYGQTLGYTGLALEDFVHLLLALDETFLTHQRRVARSG